jgi:DNA polymerase III subunit epsilon
MLIFKIGRPSIVAAAGGSILSPAGRRNELPVDWNEAVGMPLDELTLSFVDVETTGLCADQGDRVCEVAVVVCRGERELLRYCSLVNPLRPISPGAAAVNGLADAVVRRAPTFVQVAAQVSAALSLGVPVAHNAPFDLSFLASELRLAGLPLPVSGAVDTLALSRRVLPFRRYGLRDLAAQLAIRVPGQAHRALADALTTRELLSRLLDWPTMPPNPRLADVLALQGGPSPWPSRRTAPAPPLPPRLAEALRRGQTIGIVYLAADGQRTRRVVEPSEVYGDGNALYLVAYCHLRRAQRTFRLDRIVAWETV